MKELNPESLAEFNGKDGNPTYIFYQGRVIDVSASKLWKGGLHMKRHHAGEDLSAELSAAPHGEEVFERYPEVGLLKEKTEPERPMPALVSSLIERFPFLERHPHPMTVHFPIVFMLSAAFFNVLYLITDVRQFESTALHCLIGGLLFTPIAMLTGWFTWWLIYLARPMKPVVLKIVLSTGLLVISAGTLLWRIMDPAIPDSQGIARIIHLLLTLSFVPLVSLTGWLGASLTFPIKRK